jgi:hypothetical protein
VRAQERQELQAPPPEQRRHLRLPGASGVAIRHGLNVDLEGHRL